MTRTNVATILLVGLAGLGAACAPAPPPVESAITNGQGEMAGEVTTDSVILQSRLTTIDGWVDGDLRGVPGVARFEVARSADFTSIVETTDWIDATADRDYIVKTRVGGLTPGTGYVYRVVYGPDPEHVVHGPARSFATYAGAGGEVETSFMVVTGMNYYRFFDDPALAYTGPDKELGYPALVAMRSMAPDFFVGTGDNVYYDVPLEGRADTAPAMRKKWHEQFGKQRFIDFFAEVPTYWEKDDHDYRYNDSDNTSNFSRAPNGEVPSPRLGRDMFLEQVPVVDPADPNPVTYRTHRVSQDLQIWLVEGRDYRSANAADVGPDKTLWGAEQLSWLRRTLGESDATFKILISPTPLVGPDDAVNGATGTIKRDNHSNAQGFRRERDELFAWLIENGFLEKNFYIVCGDRHWQYHSRHPDGFEEFSTGAIIDANSRMGRAPGDPDSNDPNAFITQDYTYSEPTGGFLNVTITPGDAPTAAFRFYDEQGTLMYEDVKVAN
jgi:alkaline phosphatase D